MRVGPGWEISGAERLGRAFGVGVRAVYAAVSGLRGAFAPAFAALCVLPAVAASAAPVGMVTDLVGKVWASGGAEASGRQALTILSYVSAGTVIEVEKAAGVSVTLYSPPDEYVFAGPAKFRVESGGLSKIEGKAPTVQRLGELAAETTTQAINQGSRRTLAVARLRNTAFAPYIAGLSPDKTAIRTASPRFVWNGVPGIERYHVALNAGDGSALLDEWVAGAEWKLPSGYALAPGKNYSWTVEATPSEGKTARGQARFSILEADVAARLEAESPKGGASFAYRLRHALTLEALGLNEESRALWRELAHERPGEAAVQERALP
ncbi:MAG: hypothetical protein HY777_10220 [Betaproteobacteria bacterium]|nr:hypothetical protein [Betaproteobacteria bacterium]